MLSASRSPRQKDIDTAVLQQHNHANKTELDFLSDDGADHLMFRGRRVWDGKVDVASASAEGYIPDCLRDGGLLIINPAAGGGPGAKSGPNQRQIPTPRRIIPIAAKPAGMAAIAARSLSGPGHGFWAGPGLPGPA